MEVHPYALADKVFGHDAFNRISELIVIDGFSELWGGYVAKNNLF